MLLRDILPTAFFPTLWGAFQSSGYLVLFYFQTLEQSLWVCVFIREDRPLNEKSQRQRMFPLSQRTQSPRGASPCGPRSGRTAFLLLPLCTRSPLFLLLDSDPTANVLCLPGTTSPATSRATLFLHLLLPLLQA